MKKNYLLIITLIFFGSLNAQELQKNFINYQGVARNAENELMVGETILIGIALKVGGRAATPDYIENHSINTDANGVFSLKIGNGDPISGDYSNVVWGNDATFVTVSVNGTEVGTTEMMAVPYALSSGDGAQHADDVPYNNTVSGLAATNTQQAIDELVGSGLIDADADPTNEIQDISLNGTNLSISEGTTIDLSTVITASGTDDQDLSLSGTMLQITNGTGVDLAPLIPPGGTDDQNASEVAFDNAASGLAATNAQTAIDELATSGLVDTDNQDLSLTGTTLQITDGMGVDLAPLIPPGGTDDQNAAEVAFNNTASGLAATNAQTAIDELASSSLVDTDDQDLSLSGTTLQITDGTGVDLASIIPTGGTSNGFKALDQGNGIGWRLLGRDPANYGPIGLDALDASTNAVPSESRGATGFSATAIGEETTASGPRSTAMGYGTMATGSVSTAMGEETVASGEFAVAMGDRTLASEQSSSAFGAGTRATNTHATAMGEATTASGKSATAMGSSTKAESLVSFAIGRNNIGGGDPFVWQPNDPLFEIGNGSETVTSNALTVLKNGNTGIGIANPIERLEVAGTMQSTDLVGTGQRNVMADANGNLVIGSGGSGSSLWTESGSNISYSSGNVGIGTSNPQTIIDIAGGQWDLNNTNGDFRIGNDTRGLRIGVATGIGPGGGDVRLRAQGGTNRLLLGSGNEDVLNIIPGNVGIGTIDPKATLDIAGGNWDLNNGNGDFRIGNDTRGLRIGVATGDGPGGGDVRLRAQGGTDRLLLGSGNEDVIAVTSGNIEINADVNLTGEMNNSGTGTANILPIAYGTIDPSINDWLLTGTNNFTISEQQEGFLLIRIFGEQYSASTHLTTATLVNGNGFISISEFNGVLEIQTRDTQGQFARRSISFVTYKP